MGASIYMMVQATNAGEFQWCLIAKKNKYSERSENALRPVGLGLRMVMRDEMTVIPRILLTDDRWYVEDDCVC